MRPTRDAFHGVITSIKTRRKLYSFMIAVVMDPRQTLQWRPDEAQKPEERDFEGRNGSPEDYSVPHSLPSYLVSWKR